MCGIAGAVALTGDARPDHDRVRRLSELIAHRGPDGHGLWVAPSGRAVLAHRRLAIIDLAAGQQPMVDSSQQVAVSFNGEIYNYVELRDELERQGRTFRTHSDTEVLLTSYLARGTAFVDRLRGMFAIAVWDDAKGQLIVARDRVGKKPLFFTVEDNCLYFSSTLESLRATTRRRWRVSATAIDEYLAAGYILAPRTAYEEASKLEAGTILTVSTAGTRTTHRYWSADMPVEPFEGSYESAVDRVHEVLTDAVRVRLRSDVPLGVFLSGGLDSSLVTAIARREYGLHLNTFSVGFAASAHDESSAARAVAEHLGTDHHTFEADADLLEFLPDAVRHFGEPVADSAAFPLWALARHTREIVTVALSGDGGDEGFGGYDWYGTAMRLRRSTQIAGGRALAPVRRSVAAALQFGSGNAVLPTRIGRALDAMGDGDPARQYCALRTQFAERDRRRVMQGRNASTALDRMAGVFERAGGDAMRRMRCADISTYLADCLMPKVDVATMAHALEARAPLLDHPLLELALTLPASYLTDARGGKRILRDILGRYLPESLVNRPKHGFTVPLDEWFRKDARQRAVSLGRSEPLEALGLIDLSEVTRLNREHAEMQRNHGDRLFALLVLEAWARLQ